eukprot:TRINITY_DN14452_c0_g1_i1.p1 TRINITY_DN14452_c0_g1~~TRINITY_DN14452_c0_g1_i1.p1  ORF type:complete len:368 (+),score=33.04 TRINITY_DN14452_c0_g1_i1:94-1197(+)
MPLSLATLNVFQFNNGAVPIAKFIGPDVPHILAVQESDKRDKLHELAGALGMDVACTAPADFGLTNALLVDKNSVHVLRTFSIDLNVPSSEELRTVAALYCQISDAGTSPGAALYLVIATAHLDAYLEANRLAQLRILEGAMARIVADPMGNHKGARDETAPGKDALQLAQWAMERGSLSQEGYEKVKDRVAAGQRRGSPTKKRATANTSPRPDTRCPKKTKPAVRHPVDGWVLMGDFNALTKEDYTEEQREGIRNMREKACVSKPAYEVMRRLRDDLHLIDAKSVADRFSGDLATCPYSVRVDYIMANKPLLDRCRVTSLTHKRPEHQETDHSMVCAIMDAASQGGPAHAAVGDHPREGSEGPVLS